MKYMHGYMIFLLLISYFFFKQHTFYTHVLALKKNEKLPTKQLIVDVTHNNCSGLFYETYPLFARKKEKNTQKINKKQAY